MTSSATTNANLPIGTIAASVLRPDSLPAGWLPCDGSAIPAQYQELITLLNSTNTPNLIGRTLVGAGNLSTPSPRQTDGRYPNFAMWGHLIGGTLQIGDTGGESLRSLPGFHSQPDTGDGENLAAHPSVDLAYNLQPYYAVTYIIFAGP